LFGTTDKEYYGDPDHYHVTREEMAEFIDEINDSFGKEKIKEEDVLYTYGGLRPITDVQTEGTYNASRKYEIMDHKLDGIDGLISVVGGKFTTSRNLAQKVVDDIFVKLNKPLVECLTKQTRLVGGAIDDLVQFRQDVQDRNPNLSPEIVGILVENYGSKHQEVLNLIEKDRELARPLGRNAGLAAEIIYAIEEEMAITLTDILLRRTGIGMLGDPGIEDLNYAVKIASRKFGWSEKRKKGEVNYFLEKVSVPGRKRSPEPVNLRDLFSESTS
jgi:glycerol-3-phosphate dehydrogenase